MNIKDENDKKYEGVECCWNCKFYYWREEECRKNAPVKNQVKEAVYSILSFIYETPKVKRMLQITEDDFLNLMEHFEDEITFFPKMPEHQCCGEYQGKGKIQ